MKLFPKAIPFCPGCPSNALDLPVKTFTIVPPKKESTRVETLRSSKQTKKSGLF